jgi:malate dehydrogenase
VLDKLQGTVLELEDCGFSNCGSIMSTSDINEAAEDCDWALLVGSIPRGITINGKKIEERGDLLHVNGGIFTDQGNAIGSKGKEDAKILVVGNPANTNALIGKSNSNNNSQLWMAMTALDANRAKAQVSIKTNRSIEDIKGMTIWGNHSPTMYPDLDNASIDGKSVSEIINDNSWIENDFLVRVQQSGKEIIDARGASSAASAANAAIDTVKNVENDTEEDTWFSAAVASDGSYGVPEGLIFGYPLRTENGKVEIVQDLELKDYAKAKIEITTNELLEEKEEVKDLIA